MLKKKYSIILILDNVIKKNIKILLFCGSKGFGFFFYCFVLFFVGENGYKVFF